MISSIRSDAQFSKYQAISTSGKALAHNLSNKTYAKTPSSTSSLLQKCKKTSVVYIGFLITDLKKLLEIGFYKN